MTGYRYLREVDKSLCVSFCLQDPNCTAVTYSVQSPPSGGRNSSLCKFYTSVGEGVYLKMTKPEHNVQSRVVLFISKLQDVHLFQASLGGKPYSKSKTDIDTCKANCKKDFFCDAFSFADSSGSCSLFSTNNIENIVVDDNSEVTFIGQHSNNITTLI